MAELTAAGKALQEPGGIERELAKVREYKAEIERLLEGREGSIELQARVKYLSELEQELLKLQRLQSRVERLERWQGLIPNYDPWVGLSILPVLLYVLVLELFGTRAAIGAGFGSAVVVFFVQRRVQPNRGAIFWLAVLALVLLAGGSIVGWILDSDKAFFAASPVGDFITAAIFAGSLLLGRPLMGMVVREVFPGVREKLPADDRAFFKITAIFAMENLIMGIVRVWLLDEVSASVFPWISRGVGIPLRLALVWWSYQLIQRSIRRRAVVEEGRRRLGRRTKPGRRRRQRWSERVRGGSWGRGAPLCLRHLPPPSRGERGTRAPSPAEPGGAIESGIPLTTQCGQRGERGNGDYAQVS